MAQTSRENVLCYSTLGVDVFEPGCVKLKNFEGV